MKISSNFGITNPNFSGRMVKVEENKYIDSDAIFRIENGGDGRVVLRTRDGAEYVVSRNSKDLISVANEISNAKTSSGEFIDVTR